MSFSFEDITIGEMKWIENHTGQSFASISDTEKPQGLAYEAIVTVYKRRNGEPGFNPADAEKLSIREAAAIFAEIGKGEDEEDPKEK